LHWGYNEVMSLDTTERRRFVQLLSETLERQNEEMSRARHRAGS
jgi:hypothetical protein